MERNVKSKSKTPLMTRNVNHKQEIKRKYGGLGQEAGRGDNMTPAPFFMSANKSHFCPYNVLLPINNMAR